MLPRERVFAALEYREPDRIPWGEHSVDYNVYEDILGRETLVQAKMRETRALWEGRRDDVVASYKRDRLDLIRALDMDIVFVGRVPPKDYQPDRYEQITEDVYRGPDGRTYHISSTTHDLMPTEMNHNVLRTATLKSVQEKIDELDAPVQRFGVASLWQDRGGGLDEPGPASPHLRQDRRTATEAAVARPAAACPARRGWYHALRRPGFQRQLDGQPAHLPPAGVPRASGCGQRGPSPGVEGAQALLRVVDDLASIYDAYEGIQASAGMDIKRLKECVGDRLTLWGGIWHEHIIMGGVEDIREDARYAFTHAAPGGGYIMGSSHSLAVGAKRENILEMKRCRDEWGNYPIDPKRFV
jgi:hypothetical protein